MNTTSRSDGAASPNRSSRIGEAHGRGPHGRRSQVEDDALLSVVTTGSLRAAILKTDDLDATFEKVRESGAEVLQEPTMVGTRPRRQLAS